MTRVVIKCDLRHSFGEARDQGPRPTCVAFAASDAHAAARPDWETLSCEYAYFHALRHDGGGPDDGATLEGMLSAIEQDGQPPEKAWPYLSSIPSDNSLWTPPAIADPIYRRGSTSDKAGAVAAVMQRLDAGTPVIITMCLSDAFYKPEAGGVISALEAPDHTRRHAVVAVGHGMRGSETMILVRNSWGISWGIDGHGWLSEEYLGLRLYGFGEMTEDLTNVSANSITENMRSGVA